MDKKQIDCPHYHGDGYTYSLAEVEFNFCDYCNRRLFKRMVAQYKLEKETFGEDAFGERRNSKLERPGVKK